jgi:hypothetical protein
MLRLKLYAKMVYSFPARAGSFSRAKRQSSRAPQLLQRRGNRKISRRLGQQLGKPSHLSPAGCYWRPDCPKSPSLPPYQARSRV